MTHSPTPWVEADAIGQGRNYIMLRSSNSGRRFGNIGICSEECEQENVEFILRAVNNHYQLIDTLKKMVTQFQDEVDPSYAGDVETIELALKVIQEAEGTP